MPKHCPGSDNMRTPTLAVRQCPKCGKEVEVFSTDAFIKCSSCGFTCDNTNQSCYNWCRYADLCREEAKKSK
jgi:hypothetical protein